ncbi:MAG: prepilin-type N-terminal cleavage/methylation domain-containing protein [Alphaproteobacteria bacterium]
MFVNARQVFKPPLPRRGTGLRGPLSPGSAGFSLMELIVVLAVLALAAAVIAPRVPFAARAFALKAEARAIQSALEEAGARAVSTRRAETVAIDLRDLKLKGSGLERPLNREVAITATFAQAAQSDGRVATFIFFPDGTATGGRVTLRRGTRAIAVEANWLTGAVRSFDVVHN